MALILLSIFIIGYIYRKSWKTADLKAGRHVLYQRKHYEAIRPEDPSEADSLVSLNADSQSFYVLNQGKEIVRTQE